MNIGIWWGYHYLNYFILPIPTIGYYESILTQDFAIQANHEPYYLPSYGIFDYANPRSSNRESLSDGTAVIRLEIIQKFAPLSSEL